MKYVDCHKHGAQPLKPLRLGDGSFGVCCGECLEQGEIEEAWVFPKDSLRHVRLANGKRKVEAA
jgi:hypothetical protein